MWIVLLVLVVLAVAGWVWAVSRDKYLCPICRHSMSDHELKVITVDSTTGQRRYCNVCMVVCVVERP